jgi:hypothetical protein
MVNKLQNRTLFVAALSVYLGLLIVGAPPQVLAQTALTQTAKLKVEDDAPNCPKAENEEIVKLLQLAYAAPLETFIKDLQPKIKAIRREEQFSEISFQLEKYFSTNCVQENPYQLSYQTNGSDNAALFFLASELTTSVDLILQELLSDCRKLSESKEKSSDKAISVAFDGKSIELKTRIGRVSEQNAESVSRALNAAFSINACFEERDSIAKTIYQNTTVRPVGKYILIVTHLPRAALDSLVQANEKAN